MSFTHLPLFIDLDNSRLVRSNDYAVGLRALALTEGASLSGLASLVMGAEAISNDGITALSIELADANNDISLRNVASTGQAYSMDLVGANIRNYLYASDEKKALLNVRVTNSGVQYDLAAVPVTLRSNPDENTVSNGDTYISQSYLIDGGTANVSGSATVSNSSVVVNGSSIIGSGNTVNVTVSGEVPLFGLFTSGTFSPNSSYLINTSGASFTGHLPASPATGQWVKIADAKGTFGTNKFVVGRNGNKINNTTGNFECDVNDGHYTFIFVDSSYGYKVLEG